MSDDYSSARSSVQIRDGLLWDRPDWQRLYRTSPTFRDGVDRLAVQFAPAYLEGLAAVAERTDAEIRERTEQMEREPRASLIVNPDGATAGWLAPTVDD